MAEPRRRRRTGGAVTAVTVLGGGFVTESPGYVPEECGDLEVWAVSPS